MVDCTRLCQQFGLHRLSVKDILREASEDSGNPHADFLRTGLDQLGEIPADLIISLLEPHLGRAPQSSWIVIQDFPSEHLVDFERQVGS